MNAWLPNSQIVCTGVIPFEKMFIFSSLFSLLPLLVGVSNEYGNDDMKATARSVTCIVEEVDVEIVPVV